MLLFVFTILLGVKFIPLFATEGNSSTTTTTAAPSENEDYYVDPYEDYGDMDSDFANYTDVDLAGDGDLKYGKESMK